MLLAPALWAAGGVAFAEEAKYRRKVDLEFEEIPDATRYEIKVIRIKEGGTPGKPMFFKTTKPVWQAEIAPGRYMLQLRSYDDREVPGDWSEAFEYWVKIPAPAPLAPIAGADVTTKEDEEAAVELKWEPIKGVEKYRVEVMSDDQITRKEAFSDRNYVKVILPVAKSYRWRVFSRLKEDVDGEEPQGFADFALVGGPLKSPEVEEPITKVVQEIKWAPVKFAIKYSYTLFRYGEDKKWSPVGQPKEVSDPKAPFDLSQPSGTYRISVHAKGDKRQNSKAAREEFDVMGGLRTPAAVEAAVLKESLVKPTNYYFIASYMITQVNYAAKNYEQNPQSRSSFDAISGTGRLGLGYQNQRKPWGAFTIIDLGGINIDNQNFTFASAEAHGTWKLNWSGRGQVLVGSGLYYKELPILKGSKESGFEGVGKVSNIGPHAGFQYWLPFSQKFGMQFNARAYYSFMGSADGGTGVNPALSYQYGLLGSYRLKSQMMGYAGYAYRLDHSDYKSTAAGKISEIEVQGHYLNLILEYSF
jgi:hypothetical protein